MPAGLFSIQGSLTLSGEAAALEGVTGKLEGTPFTASLRFDKAPVRKLQLSLAGDNFDLSTFESGSENADALSPDSLRAAWQGGLAQVAAMLGGGPQGFDTADVDISAGGIKTSAAEAKNVAVHVKFEPDLITISKLSAETANGLVLKGEGSVPLRGVGQGRFAGRIEARSPQAIVQFAALAGYDRAGLESRATGMAPAAFGIKAETAAGTATAQLSGTMGTARLEGHAQLKGALSDWRTGQTSAQLNVSAPDGNRILSLIFPDAVLAPGASLAPGVLTLNLDGVPERFQTSASLTTGALRVQLDGAAGATAQALSFKGKATASSQTPEQFLPQSVLVLLGGEPRANLSFSANVSIAPGRFEADEMIAEAPKNLVNGHLAIAAPGGVTRVDANLKADTVSLPSLLGYFLSGTDDAPALELPATPGAAAPAPDIWSGRPFLLSAFRETSGKVAVVARTLKLTGAVVLTDAQFNVSLDKGRLDVEDLKGKTLGGGLAASFSLTAKNSAVAAEAELSISGAGLAAIAGPGKPPLLTGQGSLSLFASGQGLSPRGLISVLQGRGSIRLSDGQIAKLSPAAVQASAEELLAAQLPITEQTVAKKVLAAVQANDFTFRRLKIPVTVADGILEIRRASFRGGSATVRMEAYLDLNKAQVDSTWQMGVSSDRRQKWPPVKIMLSGPLQELGAMERTLAAEDFVRAILVRKMEGDISKLESLNKPQPAVPAWTTTTQEPAPKKRRHRRRDRTKPEETPRPTSRRGSGAELRATHARCARERRQRSGRAMSALPLGACAAA